MSDGVQIIGESLHSGSFIAQVMTEKVMKLVEEYGFFMSYKALYMN